jgi:cytochrome o ubiquinol oxidase subunit III
MTDLVLFAALFAVFAVLRGGLEGVGGGLFNPEIVLAETFILLTSSFTCGLALLSARANKKSLVLLFLAITFILGATFVGLELSEFSKLIGEGMGPQYNGFLSSFFTLVGTHGLHITIALLWMFALMLAIIARGLTESNMRKLTLLTYFWHFLDIIWIFIFTIVYLLAML